MSLSASIGMALFILTLTVAYPQKIHAKGFTADDFLAMPNVHQKFWLSGAVDSLNHAAGKQDKAYGACIVDWYFGDQQTERNALILASFKKYPDIAPSIILMALTEKSCGFKW